MKKITNICTHDESATADACDGWRENRLRLYLLRGLPCPLCQLASPLEPMLKKRIGRPPKCLAALAAPPLEWTGISLACPRGHGWRNADALHEELMNYSTEDEADA